jgi:hypothetical protein
MPFENSLDFIDFLLIKDSHNKYVVGAGGKNTDSSGEIGKGRSWRRVRSGDFLKSNELGMYSFSGQKIRHRLYARQIDAHRMMALMWCKYRVQILNMLSGLWTFSPRMGADGEDYGGRWTNDKNRGWDA